jgi:hypothetical protein
LYCVCFTTPEKKTILQNIIKVMGPFISDETIHGQRLHQQRKVGAKVRKDLMGIIGTHSNAKVEKETGCPNTGIFLLLYTPAEIV